MISPSNVQLVHQNVGVTMLSGCQVTVVAEIMVLLFVDVISDEVDNAVVVFVIVVDENEGGGVPRPILDQTMRSHCIKLSHGFLDRFFSVLVNFFHFILNRSVDELYVILSSSRTASTGSLLTLPSLFSPDKP